MLNALSCAPSGCTWTQTSTHICTRLARRTASHGPAHPPKMSCEPKCGELFISILHLDPSSGISVQWVACCLHGGINISIISHHSVLRITNLQSPWILSKKLIVTFECEVLRSSLVRSSQVFWKSTFVNRDSGSVSVLCRWVGLVRVCLFLSLQLQNCTLIRLEVFLQVVIDLSQH